MYFLFYFYFMYANVSFVHISFVSGLYVLCRSMARISTHMCVLVLTVVLLVCEIVVGRICRSLLIAVDSFHTLYVFLQLCLSALKHHPSSPPSDEHLDRRKRLEPFGVLISALLMASQCVSISLEILTHLVQPEAIQHPLLSVVVGAASLILNVLALAWRRRSGGMDGAHSPSESKGVFDYIFVLMTRD